MNQPKRNVECAVSVIEKSFSHSDNQLLDIDAFFEFVVIRVFSLLIQLGGINYNIRPAFCGRYKTMHQRILLSMLVPSLLLAMASPIPSVASPLPHFAEICDHTDGGAAEFLLDDSTSACSSCTPGSGSFLTVANSKPCLSKTGVIASPSGSATTATPSAVVSVDHFPAAITAPSGKVYDYHGRSFRLSRDNLRSSNTTIEDHARPIDEMSALKVPFLVRSVVEPRSHSAPPSGATSGSVLPVAQEQETGIVPPASWAASGDPRRGPGDRGNNPGLLGNRKNRKNWWGVLGPVWFEKEPPSTLSACPPPTAADPLEAGVGQATFLPPPTAADPLDGRAGHQATFLTTGPGDDNLFLMNGGGSFALGEKDDKPSDPDRPSSFDGRSATREERGVVRVAVDEATQSAPAAWDGGGRDSSRHPMRRERSAWCPRRMGWQDESLDAADGDPNPLPGFSRLGGAEERGSSDPVREEIFRVFPDVIYPCRSEELQQDPFARQLLHRHDSKHIMTIVEQAAQSDREVTPRDDDHPGDAKSTTEPEKLWSLVIQKLQAACCCMAGVEPMLLREEKPNTSKNVFDYFEFRRTKSRWSDYVEQRDNLPEEIKCRGGINEMNKHVFFVMDGKIQFHDDAVVPVEGRDPGPAGIMTFNGNDQVPFRRNSCVSCRALEQMSKGALVKGWRAVIAAYVGDKFGRDLPVFSVKNPPMKKDLLQEAGTAPPRRVHFSEEQPVVVSYPAPAAPYFMVGDTMSDWPLRAFFPKGLESRGAGRSTAASKGDPLQYSFLKAAFPGLNVLSPVWDIRLSSSASAVRTISQGAVHPQKVSISIDTAVLGDMENKG